MSIFFLEVVQDADGGAGDIPRRFEAPVGVEPAAKGVKKLSLYSHPLAKKAITYQCNKDQKIFEAGVEYFK